MVKSGTQNFRSKGDNSEIRKKSIRKDTLLYPENISKEYANVLKTGIIDVRMLRAWRNLEQWNGKLSNFSTCVCYEERIMQISEGIYMFGGSV